MAAMLLVLGCAGGWAGSSPSVNRAAVSGLSDAQIERDIKARLARSPKISLDKFTVKVQGGIATFEGKTNVIQHKGVATRMAKSAGAKAVVNNIQISDAARKAAADRLAEGRKKAAIVSTAAAH
jgi:osmotically-inducible protein OsmY